MLTGEFIISGNNELISQLKANSTFFYKGTQERKRLIIIIKFLKAVSIVYQAL